MRRLVYILSILILLTIGAIVCAYRWQAWFVNPAEPDWTGDTLSLHFHSFVGDSVPGFIYDGCNWVETDDDDDDDLCILLFGDVHNKVDSAMWRSIAEANPQADAYAQLGDWVERGYFYYYQRLYQQIGGSAFANLPVITIPGNHEYYKGVCKHLSPLWSENFAHPENGPYGQPTTFYVDFPNLRMICIDTNRLSHFVQYTRLMTWIRSVINTADNRFVVVMMHHPVFSSGKGRQNLLIRALLWDPLRKADVVFAGHDHGYMRKMPFINTNAATKFYRQKNISSAEKVIAEQQLYQRIDVFGGDGRDTMRVRTYLMYNNSPVDEVVLTK